MLAKNTCLVVGNPIHTQSFHYDRGLGSQNVTLVPPHQTFWSWLGVQERSHVETGKDLPQKLIKH